jgi:hypothetical protein
MARPQEQVPHEIPRHAACERVEKRTAREHYSVWRFLPARARTAFTSLCLCPVPSVSRAMSSTRYHCDMTDFRWSENAGERRETVASGGLGQSCASS